MSLAINGYDLNTLISMFNKRSYTSDGNYLTSTVSENDKETTYNYSRENGYLKSKTEPQGKQHHIHIRQPVILQNHLLPYPKIHPLMQHMVMTIWVELHP